jgi:hypothetical protein
MHSMSRVERGLHAQILAHLDIDVPAIGGWVTSTVASAGSSSRRCR